MIDSDVQAQMCVEVPRVDYAFQLLVQFAGEALAIFSEMAGVDNTPPQKPL